MSLVLIAFCLYVSFLVIQQFLRNLDSEFGRPANVALSAAGSVLCFMSPALLLQFISSLAISVIALFPIPRKIVKYSYVAACVGSYVAVLCFVLPSLREHAELRAEYPFVSLETRLNQLDHGPTNSSPNQTVTVAGLSQEVQSRLDKAEDEGRGSRARLLSELHLGTTDDFTVARGFGPVRMLMPRRERIQLPDLKPVPFESRPMKPLFDPNGSAADAPESEPIQNPPAFSILETMHLDGAADFLSKVRWGYIEDRKHVAGFVPHRFKQMPGTEKNYQWSLWTESPQPVIPTPREESRIDWAIVRLELIGLLRHPDPVAYVSDHLPQLEEVASYPTRGLTEFEKTALERLRLDEDVVIDEQPNHIRMVGSLRANSGCLKCHQVERGVLLGALSYELIADHHYFAPNRP